MISEAIAITHSTPIGNLFANQHQIHTFEGDTSLRDVFDHFTTYVSDAVIIVEKDLSVGILTLKDMVRALQNHDNLTRSVSEFMSTPLHTFHVAMSIADVIDAMAEVEFDKIVVTDADGVIGVMDRRHLHSLCYAQLTPLIKHEHNILHSLIGFVEEGGQSLFKMAITDTLTGIGNRRLLEEVFDAHQKLKDRYGVTLYLLMLDIDDFKIINDTYGHNTGDAVLKELTALISRSIRRSDLFVRWGGEEFAILLRYSNPGNVIKITEHIRMNVEKHAFQAITHLTCSFGYTSIQPKESLEEVIERADKALYRAKEDGKNCVRSADA